ncbi:MAG: hypothetical protein KDA62_16530, partial [Planctomycetales bacterium]|nr:hypothetical protein [Planctomycetales bacterium]
MKTIHEVGDKGMYHRVLFVAELSLKVKAINIVQVVMLWVAADVTSAQTTNLESIKERWRANAEARHAVRIGWTESELPHLAFRGAIQQENAPPGNSLKEEGTVTRTVSFSANGEKLRYAYYGAIWNENTRIFDNREYVSTWDGRKCRGFFGADSGEIKTTHATGFVFSKFFDMNNRHIQPVLLWARPPLDADLELVDVLPPRLVATQGLTTVTYTLDPEDFEIRKIEKAVMDTRVVTEINYKKTDGRRQPSSWICIERSLRNEDVVVEKLTGEVTNFEVNAEELPNEFCF